jgi:hypothetical protein
LPELRAQIDAKDTEIKLLKEMINSVKTMVKVKENDIARYKIKMNHLE